MGWEIDGQIVAASAAMGALYMSVVVNRQLSQKMKISTGKSLTLIYGNKLGHDREKEIADIWALNEFSPQGEMLCHLEGGSE